MRVLSLLIGLLYGALLPMLPSHPALWGGVVAPLLWTGLMHAALRIVDPELASRISWPWFVVTQIAFGLVAGFVVARSEKVATFQHAPLRAARGRRDAGRPMTRALVPALLVLAVAACDRLPGRPPASDRPLRPSQVLTFAPLWAENCAGCHGDDRQPAAAVSLADPVYLELVDDATLARVTAEGVAGTAMPAFARSAGGTLTDAQINVLVAGMRAEWARPGTLAGFPVPPYAAPAGRRPARCGGVRAALRRLSRRDGDRRGERRIDRRRRVPGAGE